jgi:hypothetical protein
MGVMEGGGSVFRVRRADGRRMVGIGDFWGRKIISCIYLKSKKPKMWYGIFYSLSYACSKHEILLILGHSYGPVNSRDSMRLKVNDRSKTRRKFWPILVKKKVLP